MAAEARQLEASTGASATDIGSAAALSAPEAAQTGIALLDLPWLDGVLLMVGPEALARLDASCRLCRSFLQGDSLWEQLAKLMWPIGTILPVLHRHYPTARSLVSDRNRRGARQVWRLHQARGQGRWHWKFNDTHRFYSGRATLAAVDAVKGHFCLYIHALSNMPDLRPPYTSSIYEAPFVDADWHDLTCACPLRRLPSVEYESEICSAREQKGIMRWQASHFLPGCSYAFVYATQAQRPQKSDYPFVPLFSLPAASGTHVSSGFESLDEWSASSVGEVPLRNPKQESDGLRALEKFASSVDGAFYVPPDHVEHEEECSEVVLV